MRLALLADAHGNLPALEAVLADIDARAPDLVLHLGDLVNGAPSAAACWDLVAARGVAGLRGNHERYALETAADPDAYRDRRWAPTRWTVADLGPARLERIAALPAGLLLHDVAPDADAPPLHLVHSSPHRDRDLLLPGTPDAELRAALAGARAPTLARGHGHVAFERRAGSVHVVSLGAVGLPLEGDREARWTELEPSPAGGWSARVHRVPYDVAAAERAFADSGYLEAGGPVARLFLEEVRTGRSQVVAFLKGFRGEDLEGGVRAFLAAAG